MATEPDAVTYFRENKIRAFAMYRCIGAIGGIWCCEVQSWVEPRAEAKA